MNSPKQVSMETLEAATAAVVGGDPSFLLSPDVVVLSDPNGSRAEALRTLRTHIMAQHVVDGRRGLAVCAPAPAVGATFVAVNLATSLAQIGVKVLLIDADLRRPQVQSFIRPSIATPGLAECLIARDTDLSAYTQSEVIENLSVMFAGNPVADAQELLAGEHFSQVIERCLRDYDLCIVDTPPANSCADARRISTVVGYSIIVAKRHHTFVNDVKALTAQLREDRAQVIGSVMNEG